MAIPGSETTSLKASTEMTYARKASGLVRGLSHVGRFRRRLHEPGAHAQPLGHHQPWARRLPRRQPDARHAHLGRPRRHRLPDRLGRARRLHAPSGRRVHLQLAHHPPASWVSARASATPSSGSIVDLRAGAVDRRPGPDDHVVSYIGWTGVANFVSNVLGRVRHRDGGQHRRLPVRGLRHQEVRAHPEGRHVLRHRRLRRHRASCCSLSTRRPSSHNWNVLAAQYHSLDYAAFIPAVSKASRPGHADHLELVRHVRRSWWRFVAVRLRATASRSSPARSSARTRPSSSSNLFAIMVPAVFMIWIASACSASWTIQLLSATRLDRQERPRPRASTCRTAPTSSDSAM